MHINEMTTKVSEQNARFRAAQNDLNSLKCHLESIKWSEGQIASDEVGKHLSAVEQLISDLCGRMGTLAQESRVTIAREVVV